VEHKKALFTARLKHRKGLVMIEENGGGEEIPQPPQKRQVR